MFSPKPTVSATRCTPYLVWVGFVDWWQERRRVTPIEAVEEVRDAITGGGPLTTERSVTLVQHIVGFIGLFGIIILATAWLAPPVVKSVAPVVGSGGLAGLAGILATLMMGALLLLPLLWVRKKLKYFCERGKRVLAQRALVLEAPDDYTNQQSEEDPKDEGQKDHSGDPPV